MMKFQKKLALADIAPPATNDQYQPSDSHGLSDILSSLLRNLDQLCRRLYTYPSNKEINQSKKMRPGSSKTDSLDSFNWAPLIKAKPSRTASPTNFLKNDNGIATLAGQTVLCVGGRSRLYPIYSRLTEHMGGRLVTFHGDPNDQLTDLPRLLEKTDLIICPIDCVNHEAFFMVKFYCRFTGKPCVLLERSESTSFQNGISMLSQLFSESECHLAGHSGY
jgi:hypothetical protein